MIISCNPGTIVAIGGQTSIAVTITDGMPPFTVQHPNDTISTTERSIELPGYGVGTYDHHGHRRQWLPGCLLGYR